MRKREVDPIIGNKGIFPTFLDNSCIKTDLHKEDLKISLGSEIIKSGKPRRTIRFSLAEGIAIELAPLGKLANATNIL